MASSPITSWQAYGEIMETMTGLIFLDSKSTSDGDCSHEIKRRLVLRRKAMTNVDSVFKSRDYFSDKVSYSQSYGFSSHVWMWELDNKEGWAPKNWCFWTVVLEKTLESPLDCKEIKPESILKETNTEYSLEGLMLKKLQYFGHLVRRADSLKKKKKKTWCWERLKAGGDGDDREQDGWIASATQWTWVWASSRRQWRTGTPGVLQSMGLKRVRHNWQPEQQQRIITNLKQKV